MKKFSFILGAVVLLIAILSCTTSGSIPTPAAYDPPAENTPAATWDVERIDTDKTEVPADAYEVNQTESSSEATVFQYDDYVISAYDAKGNGGVVIEIYLLSDQRLPIIKLNAYFRPDGALIVNKSNLAFGWSNIAILKVSPNDNLVVSLKDAPFNLALSLPGKTSQKQLWLADNR